MTFSPPGPADRTLVIERDFAAPPHIVFEAWSSPEHLVEWFGPNDFTLPSCETDFREGGRYRFCMRSPSGVDHWVWGEYREIISAKRLVFTWNREDGSGNIWNSTVVDLTFSEAGERTKLRLIQTLFENAADRDAHNGGWTEALERLNVYVKEVKRI